MNKLHIAILNILKILKIVGKYENPVSHKRFHDFKIL